METQLFGFFIGTASGRIYQKIKYSRHYAQGTLLYVDVGEDYGSNVDYTELPAFTISDSDYSEGTPKYVGIVASVDGVTASADQKITLCSDAEINIDAYNKRKNYLVSNQGSSTMGLPTISSNSLIVGFGKLKLTEVLGGFSD